MKKLLILIISCLSAFNSYGGDLNTKEINCQKCKLTESIGEYFNSKNKVRIQLREKMDLIELVGREMTCLTLQVDYVDEFRFYELLRLSYNFEEFDAKLTYVGPVENYNNSDYGTNKVYHQYKFHAKKYKAFNRNPKLGIKGYPRPSFTSYSDYAEQTLLHNNQFGTAAKFVTGNSVRSTKVDGQSRTSFQPYGEDQFYKLSDGQVIFVENISSGTSHLQQSSWCWDKNQYSKK